MRKRAPVGSESPHPRYPVFLRAYAKTVVPGATRSYACWILMTMSRFNGTLTRPVLIVNIHPREASRDNEKCSGTSGDGQAGLNA